MDLCKEIFEKRLHLPTEFTENDWDTCQSKVYEGEWDFVITSHTPERLKFVDSQIHAAPFQLLMSKKSPYHEILHLIDQKFREVRQDRAFEKLLAPYES